MSTTAKLNKAGTKKTKSSTGNKSSAEELKTEGPLSEKDEVKKAEEKIRKHIKHNS